MPYDSEIMQEIYFHFSERFSVKSWSELGRRLGLRSIGYPRLIANGERNISDNIWLRLELCGMNPSWRFNQSTEFWQSDINISKKGQELLDAVSHLSDSEIEFLLRQARLLTNSSDGE